MRPPGPPPQPDHKEFPRGRSWLSCCLISRRKRAAWTTLFSRTDNGEARESRERTRRRRPGGPTCCRPTLNVGREGRHVAAGVSPAVSRASCPAEQAHAYPKASGYLSIAEQPGVLSGREIRTGVWTCRFAAADAAL